jgi:hypothetical protein
MIRLFRKIRFGFLAGEKFSKYLLYAVGEIVLLVIGILIALQINNWNTRRIEKANERKIYRNIRRQVVDDRNELLRVQAFNNFYSGQYEYANQLMLANDRTQIDTLAIIVMNLSRYSDFQRSGNIYETLVNSGELKLLKNQGITSQLQKLEMTYNYMNMLEKIHWEIIINELSPEVKGVINYATLKIIKPEKLYSVELQNILIESLFLTKGKEGAYNQAQEDIKTLIGLIDEELGVTKEE